MGTTALLVLGTWPRTHRNAHPLVLCSATYTCKVEGCERTDVCDLSLPLLRSHMPSRHILQSCTLVRLCCCTVWAGGVLYRKKQTAMSSWTSGERAWIL